MRKGYALIELLVVVSVLAILSIPLAHLTKVTIVQIPNLYKAVQTNTSLLDFLDELKKDINAAETFGGAEGLYGGGLYVPDGNELLIRLGGKTVGYEFAEEKIVKFAVDEKEARTVLSSWAVPKADVQWRVCKNGDKPFALEVSTCVKQKSGKVIDRKMANSRLLFKGAYQEAID